MDEEDRERGSMKKGIVHGMDLASHVAEG